MDFLNSDKLFTETSFSLLDEDQSFIDELLDVDDDHSIFSFNSNRNSWKRSKLQLEVSDPKRQKVSKELTSFYCESMFSLNNIFKVIRYRRQLDYLNKGLSSLENSPIKQACWIRNENHPNISTISNINETVNYSFNKFEQDQFNGQQFENEFNQKSFSSLYDNPGAQFEFNSTASNTSNSQSNQMNLKPNSQSINQHRSTDSQFSYNKTNHSYQLDDNSTNCSNIEHNQTLESFFGEIVESDEGEIFSDNDYSVKDYDDEDIEDIIKDHHISNIVQEHHNSNLIRDQNQNLIKDHNQYYNYENYDKNRNEVHKFANLSDDFNNRNVNRNVSDKCNYSFKAAFNQLNKFTNCEMNGSMGSEFVDYESNDFRVSNSKLNCSNDLRTNNFQMNGFSDINDNSFKMNNLDDHNFKTNNFNSNNFNSNNFNSNNFNSNNLSEDHFEINNLMDNNFEMNNLRSSNSKMNDSPKYNQSNNHKIRANHQFNRLNNFEFGNQMINGNQLNCSQMSAETVGLQNSHNSNLNLFKTPTDPFSNPFSSFKSKILSYDNNDVKFKPNLF